jgi:hypothetical protein
MEDPLSWSSWNSVNLYEWTRRMDLRDRLSRNKVHDLQNNLVKLVKNKLKCPEQLWNTPINLDNPAQVDQVEEDLRSRVAELAARTVARWGLSHWIDDIEKNGVAAIRRLYEFGIQL